MLWFSMYICTYFCMSVQNKTCRVLNACSCLLHHTDSGNAFMNKQEIFHKGREIFLPFSLVPPCFIQPLLNIYICLLHSQSAFYQQSLFLYT